jgi:hypothetical protein
MVICEKLIRDTTGYLCGEKSFLITGIANYIVYEHEYAIVQRQVCRDMANNLNHLIEKIKENAVGRCRERIDLAADKAREVLNGKKPENQEDSPIQVEPHSVTSCMKQRHGL